MKNQMRILAIAVFFGLVASSCMISAEGIRGSGNVVTQTRPASEKFTEIDVDAGIEVVVSQGDSQSIVVEADDNIQKHIITRIENGVLYITSEHQNFVNVNARKVVVKMTEIRKLATSSGASMESQGVLMSTDLVIEADSGSEIDLSVEADRLICETGSGSTAVLRGKALLAETTSGSGSSLDASGLLANEVFAQASSGSSSDVNALVSLDANASSASSIDYRGTPKKLTVKESSGGSVSSN